LALVLNMLLFFYLLPPEQRRRIVRQMVSFALGVLVLLFALRYRLLELPPIFGPPAEGVDQAVTGSAAGPRLAPFQPPQLAPWSAFVISLASVLVLFILAWLFHRWWQKIRTRHPSKLGSIAAIARTSIDDLGTGRYWGDVVIETYARMSEALSAQRGLSRELSTTPREFAVRLQREGLPADAVAGLTGLFEAVRYGGRQSSAADARNAIACLQSIVQACGARA
jgi:hypothetical protein